MNIGLFCFRVPFLSIPSLTRGIKNTILQAPNMSSFKTSLTKETSRYRLACSQRCNHISCEQVVTLNSLFWTALVDTEACLWAPLDGALPNLIILSSEETSSPRLKFIPGCMLHFSWWPLVQTNRYWNNLSKKGIFGTSYTSSWPFETQNKQNCTLAPVIKVSVSSDSRWALRGANVSTPNMSFMRYFKSKKRNQPMAQPGKVTPVALRPSGPDEG